MAMTKRIDAIDFWRGLVLLIIFVNHIPGNVLEFVTPRNFGFSDSAEAFVFLSGLSVVLAYGNRFLSQSADKASVPVLKRALRLYVTHLVLTFLGLALVGAAFLVTHADDLIHDYGRAALIYDPYRALPAIFALSHQIGYFNILPLYVVLMLAAPLYLMVGMRNRWAMLGGAATLYLVARVFDINLPTWPADSGWYFDPLCWQFIFAIGMFIGFTIRAEPVPYSRVLFWMAAVYAVVVAFVVSNVFGTMPGLVDHVGTYLDWSKTDLGTIRIIDFLAHAYLLAHLSLTAKLKRTPIYAPVTLLGRNSLFAFCSVSLLSALGQILKQTWQDSVLFDIVFVGAGIYALCWMVNRLEWQRLSPASR
jgi:hypothetical protein